MLKLAADLLPEFFLFLGIDFFVALSLLTCLMDHFSRPVSYLYQAAAVFGYVNLLASKAFLLSFGEYMRFSYCFLYLILALANIIGINAYILVSKKKWNLAKIFASCITFPTILISAFYLSLYGGETSQFLTIALLFSIAILGAGGVLMVSPEKLKEKLGRG